MSDSSTRPRPKPVHWFAAQAIALGVLIGLWQAPRAAYPALFHAHANALLQWIEQPYVRLGAPGADAEAGTDTAMIGAPRAGSPSTWESSFSVVRIGYWPSALLVALLLATPLAPARRAVSLALGLVLVDLFTLLRIAAEIAYATYQVDRSPDALHGPVFVLLRIGSESLTATIPSAALVLVCWVLAARPRDSIDLRSAYALIGARPR